MEKLKNNGEEFWTFRFYMKAIGEYYKSLEKYPNPQGVSLTKFGKK